MTKMAAMAIASTFNILLFRIRKPMSFKLCMKHQEEELYKVNHDPVMTLTYFTATVKMPFEGGGWNIDNGLTIYDSEKKYVGLSPPRGNIHAYIIIKFIDLLL